MTITDRPARNGVDVPTLFATLDAVKANPEIAKFQFRATNSWVERHPQPLDDPRVLRGDAGDDPRRAAHSYDADHPAVLVGADNGPTPVEYLLHALAACLTAGIANIAAARGVDLTRCQLHRRGRHRPDGPARARPAPCATASRRIKVNFVLRGDDPEALRRIVEQSQARSAVLDVITNGVPVSIEVDAA